jgi:hypothetical protein
MELLIPLGITLLSFAAATLLPVDALDEEGQDEERGALMALACGITTVVWIATLMIIGFA